MRASKRDVIASCLVIALGVILVIHFAFLGVYGGVYIYENNKVVLLVETVMSIAILGFGVERYYFLWRNTRRQRGEDRRGKIKC